MTQPRRKPFVPCPPLTIPQILAWADDFHERTGRWPKTCNGVVPADRNEKWMKVNQALRLGLRGLPGGYRLSEKRPR